MVAQASPTKSSSPLKTPTQRSEAQASVWEELFGTVSGLDETIETALQAYTPPDAGDKVVSATTKRRLLIKSLAQLKQGKQGIQLLTEHLRALQAASQQWQRTMMYASKSHEELMEQLENTNRDLHLTTERLRKVEAQRLTAVREAEGMRLQAQQMELERKAMQAAAKRRDEDLETAQFTQAEAQNELARLRQIADEAKVAAAEAQQTQDRAVASLDGVKAEAVKAASNAERHQEAVAKLTADNLVFLMNLKKTEAELAAANQEKLQLRQAAEKQRGPWFDKVRAGVEERVRQAMTRAEALELELESTRQHHHCELQDVLGQKADLEEFLAQMRQHEADLEAALLAARNRQAEAEEEALTATTTASQLRARVEALEAEARVSISNLKAMREECTERWVNEQAALGQFNELQARIASLEQAAATQQEVVQQLQAQFESQLSINRQLMQKKEDVEWQLMTTLAKVDGGGQYAHHVSVPSFSPKAPPPPHQQPHQEERVVVLAPPVMPSPPSSSHHTPRTSLSGSPPKGATGGASRERSAAHASPPGPINNQPAAIRTSPLQNASNNYNSIESRSLPPGVASFQPAATQTLPPRNASNNSNTDSRASPAPGSNFASGAEIRASTSPPQSPSNVRAGHSLLTSPPQATATSGAGSHHGTSNTAKPPTSPPPQPAPHPHVASTFYSPPQAPPSSPHTGHDNQAAAGVGQPSDPLRVSNTSPTQSRTTSLQQHRDSGTSLSTSTAPSHGVLTLLPPSTSPSPSTFLPSHEAAQHRPGTPHAPLQSQQQPHLCSSPATSVEQGALQGPVHSGMAAGNMVPPAATPPASTEGGLAPRASHLATDEEYEHPRIGHMAGQFYAAQRRFSATAATTPPPKRS